MQNQKESHRTVISASIALEIWVLISVLVAGSLIVMYRWKGQAGLDIILVTGPYSKFWLTFLSVLIAWLLGGLALWLIEKKYIHKGNALTWAGFFIISLLYLNLLRERLTYGDLASYVLGATNLVNGQPFDRLYIYPPFWAILLKPLVPYGEDAFLVVLWVLNILSLMAFYFLMHLVLEKYGFSPHMAAIVVTLFLGVNMAVLRTMYYMQVNLHVLNLIFISLLLYPRSRMLSALALSLAIHFKVSPAALALAFLLERDWRWLAWLAFFTLFIFAITVVSDGLEPYQSFLYNLGLLNIPHGLNFRETSFDSFFWAITQLLHLNYVFPRVATYISKAALGVASLFVMVKAVRGKSYYEGASANLFNAIPPLMILMNMYSPLVWEHHGVFLVLGVIVLLRRLDTPAEWIWFGAFYFVQFLIPTFDFFPWSYARMLTPLLLLWMLWRVTKRPPGETALFRRVKQWLENLPALPA